jgi:hypothetical protein
MIAINESHKNFEERKKELEDMTKKMTKDSEYINFHRQKLDEQKQDDIKKKAIEAKW